MKLTSEIIQTNLFKFEKICKLFPILNNYKELIVIKSQMSIQGNLYTDEYYQLEEKIRLVRDEARTYKLNIYLDFIDFISKTLDNKQQVFYKNKIKNKDFQECLVSNSIDEEAKKIFKNKTKSSFEKFINSSRWLSLSGDNYSRSRSRKRYSDNLYRSASIIANYCIQNEIEIQSENLGRISHWYTKLLPDPDESISKEVNRTNQIIDLVVAKLNEGESDFRKVNLEHLMMSLKKELKKRILSLQRKDKIKCIEVPSDLVGELTQNKVYEIASTNLDQGSLKIEIVNDKDERKSYFFRNFETISTLRDNFIDDLLSNF